MSVSSHNDFFLIKKNTYLQYSLSLLASFQFAIQFLSCCYHGHMLGEVLKYVSPPSPGGSEWIISVGDYADNSFTVLGSSDRREVSLEL